MIIDIGKIANKAQADNDQNNSTSRFHTSNFACSQRAAWNVHAAHIAANNAQNKAEINKPIRQETNISK